MVKIRNTLVSPVKYTFNGLCRTKAGNRLFFMLVRALEKEKACAPSIVRIEATNFCNGKCIFCPHGKQTRTKGIMRFELFKKIIDECVQLGTGEVHLQNFGEPFFDPMIFKKIRYAKKSGIKTVMYTNASLLDEKKIKPLIGSGLDELFISFEGYSKELYEKMRTGLKYDIVSKNIKNLASIKKAMHKGNPKIILNVVYSPKYQKYVPEFEKTWSSYADKICFQKEHNWTLTQSNSDFPTICNTFWSNMTVLWDGRVTFCCLDWNGQHFLGDANKNTLLEIWNNEAYTALRKNVLKSNVKSIPLCKNCSLLEDDDVYLNFIKFLASRK